MSKAHYGGTGYGISPIFMKFDQVSYFKTVVGKQSPLNLSFV